MSFQLHWPLCHNSANDMRKCTTKWYKTGTIANNQDSITIPYNQTLDGWKNPMRVAIRGAYEVIIVTAKMGVAMLENAMTHSYT